VQVAVASGVVDRLGHAIQLAGQSQFCADISRVSRGLRKNWFQICCYP
jgi:hypothetical protein